MWLCWFHTLGRAEAEAENLAGDAIEETNRVTTTSCVQIEAAKSKPN